MINRQIGLGIFLLVFVFILIKLFASSEREIIHWQGTVCLIFTTCSYASPMSALVSSDRYSYLQIISQKWQKMELPPKDVKSLGDKSQKDMK